MIYLLAILNWLTKHANHIVIALSVVLLLASAVMWYQTQLHMWTLGVSAAVLAITVAVFRISEKEVR